MGKDFSFLTVVQFLDAFNENYFKYLVIYYLIVFDGEQSTSMITSIAGAAFILPFIFFSSFGGDFADRWRKTSIICGTRFAQVFFMILAWFFVKFHGGGLIYVILFLVATTAAIFGPSKYGIIAEIVTSKKLIRANGIVAALTYFGIIFGTSFASWTDALFKQDYVGMVEIALFISLLGSLLSLGISKTAVAAPNQKWSFFVYREIVESLRDMRGKPGMLTAMFCYSYLLFLGAYMQMNIIPYSIDTLKMGAAVGGYLFLILSVGLGVGALIASRLSGTLAHLPWYGSGMSVGCYLFTLFPLPIWLNFLWLIGIGILGGLFLVPPQTYIMAKSPAAHKGRNFGTANFLSFVLALFAALLFYFVNVVLGVSPGVSFSWLGTLNLGVSFALFFLIKENRIIE